MKYKIGLNMHYNPFYFLAPTSAASGVEKLLVVVPCTILCSVDREALLTTGHKMAANTF